MRKTTTIKDCRICQKEMVLPEWLARKRTYCSKMCYVLGQKKDSYLKNKKECLVCISAFKKSSFSKGKYCSHVCYAISLKGVPALNKGTKRPSLGGENHWNWRGGVTLENHQVRQSIEYRLWREAVFARDGFTCQDCEEQGGNLHAHHIKQFAIYPELRFAIDNGTTLCKKCHLKINNQNASMIKNNLTNL